jgi:hypothetical protein
MMAHGATIEALAKDSIFRDRWPLPSFTHFLLIA